jgi:hypothetical protein
MNSIAPYLVCYIFKGESYSVQKRIGFFVDKLYSDEDIRQTFNKFYQVNKEVQLKAIPSLVPLIKEIFIDKKIHFEVIK